MRSIACLNERLLLVSNRVPDDGSAAMALGYGLRAREQRPIVLALPRGAAEATLWSFRKKSRKLRRLFVRSYLASVEPVDAVNPRLRRPWSRRLRSGRASDACPARPRRAARRTRGA